MAEVKLRHRKNVETRSSEDRSVNQADSQAPQKLPCLKNNHDNEDTEEILKGFFNTISNLIGVTVMILLAYFTVWYFQMLHENLFWFTNIQEIEREISFRTEQGLYYSYYKQLVSSDDFYQAVRELQDDYLSEHGRTINVLARFNIYQEVVLAALYRYFNIQIYMLPIMFYVKSVFILQALLTCGIYLTSWLLGQTWLAGMLAVCWFIFHKNDASRVDYSVPLRESFSLPFLFCQMAVLTAFLKPNLSKLKERLLLFAFVLLTFLYCVTWQFAQFVSLLQAMSLFGVGLIKQTSTVKIIQVLVLHQLCLLLISWLQFGNNMILTSLVVSFIPVAIVTLLLKGFVCVKGILNNLVLTALAGIITVLLTILLNKSIKFCISDASDDHIFKYLIGKLGFDDPMDFESRLYLCNDAFKALDYESYQRLSSSTLFPLYCIILFVLLSRFICNSLLIWEHDSKTDADNGNSMEVTLHTVYTILCAILGIAVLRMKCIWVPYICIISAAGISNPLLWNACFGWCSKYSFIFRRVVCALFIIFFVQKIIHVVSEQMENLNEFWDPDTVELMEWIISHTPRTAAFAGSMQLLAGVKLCTGRPITNHPHFEDKWLRQRTIKVYQVYSQQPPEYVYDIMHEVNASYIILENSICFSPDQNHCHLIDILDLHNGHLPEYGDNIFNLTKSPYPRFCEQVQYDYNYQIFFKPVFSNKTFRVYKVKQK